MTLKQQIAEKIAGIISPFTWEELHPNAKEVYLDHADAINHLIIKEIEGKKETSSMLDSEMDRADTWGFNRALDTIVEMLREEKK